MRLHTIRKAVCAAAILLTTSAYAGEKQLMHCFAWTSVKEATPADWDAFFKASDAMPTKIAGVLKVWYGKLTRPMPQTQPTKMDADSRKKLMAGDAVTTEVKGLQRDWGMCIAMKDADTLKAYADDPFHKTWNAAYEKVRVPGTTTFDLLGQ